MVNKKKFNLSSLSKPKRVLNKETVIKECSEALR